MYYCLVPTNELTQAMINRSNSITSSDMPIIVINSINYYVVEFEETTATTYDSYRWYTQTEMQKLIEENV